MQGFLLEDDPVHAAQFIRCLEGSRMKVEHFSHPREFFQALACSKPQLIVLDWVLPELSGYKVLKRVRELLGSSTPVIMLSCVDDDQSVVDALEAGADDFLVKPLSQSVLRARLDAFLRRIAPPATVPRVIELGPYRFDYNRQLSLVNGVAVSLTPKEFDVAWVLINNPGRFISKAELVASVWGRSSDIAPHTISQHMHSIRKKLRFNDHHMRLSAVYGSGYRFEMLSQEVIRLVPGQHAA